MKKYAIKNKDEVAERIYQLGYTNKSFDNIEDNEYVYSTAILINWVLKHWEFCLEKNFTIPYPIARVHSSEFQESHKLNKTKYIDNFEIKIRKI